MGKPGVLLYRCRLCGEIERSPHVPDVEEALCCLVVDGAYSTEGSTATMLTMHYCGSGRVGIADLIGAEGDPGD